MNRVAESDYGGFQMHLMQLIRCATGHHVRSSKHSRLVDGRRESVCRGCGRRMVKDDFAMQLLGEGGTAGDGKDAR